MRVLIDTNVALDILLNNAVFYANSMAVYVHAEQKYLTGYISASAVTDIYYIAKKSLGKTIAREAIKKMLQVFQPATVTDNDIFKALELEWSDFEDSVQYLVGENLSVGYIVTRNTQDFISGNIPAVTPEQFIEIIEE
jgi:predicted nucleic acid-binding protein